MHLLNGILKHPAQIAKKKFTIKIKTITDIFYREYGKLNLLYISIYIDSVCVYVYMCDIYIYMNTSI